MHVLIVEDEAIVARDLAVTVTAFGHHVVGIVDTGEAALALAAQEHPDLVLLDIRLPGALDGIATAQQFHARLQLPVIYLTAHTDEVTLARAAATAPVGYLIMPLPDLVAQVVAVNCLVAALRDSRQRVEVIALVHELLYRADNLTLIDAAAYVEHLSSQLVRPCTDTPGRVSLMVKVESLTLSLNQVVPCGLWSTAGLGICGG